MAPRAALSALALACLATGCRHKAEPPRPRQAVRVETVTQAPAQILATYSGTALAQTQIDLAFKVGGYVETLATVRAGKAPAARPLQAGDRVEKGMVLATLRESDYKARVAEFAGMSGDAASQVTRAKADLERAQKLLATGSIPQAEYDAAKARYGQAAGASAAAGARVAGANIALGDTRLKAPFDGIVLHRHVEVGALVGPGAPGFVIADTRSMRVVFGVPDAVQRAITVDHTVAATTDALPGRTFAGAVTKIAAQADPKTRVFDIEATIPNDDQALKVGMVMQVQIDLRSAPPPEAPAPAFPEGASPAAKGRAGATATTGPLVLIPLSAVVRPPGQATGFAVFVVGPGKDAEVVGLRVVRLGDLVGSRVSVEGGLSAGEKLVVQGASLLEDGQPVHVVP